MVKLLDDGIDRFDRWQRRHRVTAVPFAVVKKLGDDDGGSMAALVAYYAFFSIFPLLLAATTILGYLARGSLRLRERFLDSAMSQIPVIGTQLESDRGLSGNAWALIVGLGAALWAGQGAMLAAQDALNRVWSLPRRRYPNFLTKRLRALFGLLIFGAGLLGAGLLANVPNLVGGLPALTTVVLIVANIAIDALIFLGAFVALTTGGPGWRAHVPGAVLAGIGYYGLQLIGAYYVTRTVQGAEDTYGTFAVVIGLLAWLYLQAQLTLIAAEVNVVVHRRLWPRGMSERDPTGADLTAVRSQALSQQRRADETIEVRFNPQKEIP